MLVVDTHTANLPWELMLADDPAQVTATDATPKALALRIPLVRQFATLDFRPHVRQSAGRTALVVGNPSLARFLAFFPGHPKLRTANPLTCRVRPMRRCAWPARWRRTAMR